MRGFLLFLAIAFPVVLASPFFWMLVRMETSVQEVHYGHQDGTVQRAWLGPLAIWPDWAIAPAHGQLRVRSHFEATVTAPASGMADVSVKQAPRTSVDAYVRALESHGWTVETYTQDVALPELPPRRMRMCHVDARRKDPLRTLLLSVDGDAATTEGSLYWSLGHDRPRMIGAVAGPC
jgi:hypothetical protein